MHIQTRSNCNISVNNSRMHSYEATGTLERELALDRLKSDLKSAVQLNETPVYAVDERRLELKGIKYEWGMHDTCITGRALGGRARHCSPTTKTDTLIMRLLTMRFKCRSSSDLCRSGFSFARGGAHGAFMQNVRPRDCSVLPSLKIMLSGYPGTRSPSHPSPNRAVSMGRSGQPADRASQIMCRVLIMIGFCEMIL